MKFPRISKGAMIAGLGVIIAAAAFRGAAQAPAAPSPSQNRTMALSQGSRR